MSQLDLFSPVPTPKPKPLINVVADDTQKYVKDFLPTFEKLINDKHLFITSCENWWRSRFSEFITRNNSAPKDKAEYSYREKGWENWESIWKEIKALLVKYKCAA